MNTTTDKLNKLLQTKEAIKTAIKAKNVPVADSDPFSSYSSKIESITSGGGTGLDWSELGYLKRPSLIDDGFEYAKIIVSNAAYYNNNTTFENDMQLVYFPTIDWSNISMFNYKFANCSRLQYVGKINGNKMNPNFTYTFQNCPALHTIELLELDYAVINFTTFNGSDYLTNLTCTNLGKIFQSTTFQFGNIQYWSYQTMIDSLLNYSYDRSGETDNNH